MAIESMEEAKPTQIELAMIGWANNYWFWWGGNRQI
ncbi:hypothetical protein C1752_03271 [Acaryochloris thomasi RCC1774]|uniref:Uncharacterized protein n=1 Tax=Acaryochloris thomasi RCC1774 TaxID=1764569 RepID=A0A2W1JPU6_9CYAN|nr:hypothetical protein C1752_03271 [Acaryochloris thomasi RCC1774]